MKAYIGNLDVGAVALGWSQHLGSVPVCPGPNKLLAGGPSDELMVAIICVESSADRVPVELVIGRMNLEASRELRQR